MECGRRGWVVECSGTGVKKQPPRAARLTSWLRMLAVEVAVVVVVVVCG